MLCRTTGSDLTSFYFHVFDKSDVVVAVYRWCELEEMSTPDSLSLAGSRVRSTVFFRRGWCGEDKNAEKILPAQTDWPSSGRAGRRKGGGVLLRGGALSQHLTAHLFR